MSTNLISFATRLFVIFWSTNLPSFFVLNFLLHVYRVFTSVSSENSWVTILFISKNLSMLLISQGLFVANHFASSVPLFTDYFFSSDLLDGLIEFGILLLVFKTRPLLVIDKQQTRLIFQRVFVDSTIGSYILFVGSGSSSRQTVAMPSFSQRGYFAESHSFELCEH